MTTAQQDTLWPPALRRDAAALRARIDAATALPSDAALGPASRLIVVHDWRRIALRAPGLPDALAPADWQGPALRQAVADALERWPRLVT